MNFSKGDEQFNADECPSEHRILLPHATPYVQNLRVEINHHINESIEARMEGRKKENHTLFEVPTADLK